VKLVLSDEQEELRDSIRRFLSDRSPMASVRRVAETPDGLDRAVWDRMGAELGLQGLAIPEEYGGAGFGHVERSVAMEEMGRGLLPSPFLASAVLAADTLLALDDEAARRELLPGIAAGETIATVALAGDGVVTAARDAGDGWTLDGQRSFVLDGCAAGAILVEASADGEPAVFLVAGDAPGLCRRPLTTLDVTRRQARLELGRTPARRLESRDTAGALAHVLDLAAVALAAEQVGGLQRCLDMSVDYAKARAQFGRPIGSFQAVKHLCANMHVAMELARSAARYAAWAADEAPDELPVAACVAQVECSEAFFQVAADTIQVHGGIGFTWEHDAHLYYRRAKASELLFGDPDHHRALLADRLSV
jgi:acyl-CoA dehydrogenase